jgi:LacI family transcriptional regulator
MAKKYKSKDLAARLGISATVVSLVLNNKGDKYGVKKDTQERILILAEQMGFFAQSSDSADSKPAFPVEDKPGIAGMITPSLNDPFVVQITPLLQSAFASIGIGFSVISKDTDDQRFGRMLSALRKNYSGLILLGDSADDTTIRSLKAGDYPFIILEKTVKTLRLNTIATDTAAGASAVMSHIEKLGYKNIIIVDDRRTNTAYARPADEIVSIIDKTEGMKQPETIEIDKTFTGSDSDFAKFEKLMRPPFSAQVIIVTNADLVYPIMRIFKKKGIRIPQDIALVSMEDGIGFDLMFSPVTALRKNLESIALKAANMLWSEVKNSGTGKFKRQVAVPPELVIRNSCGGN